MYKHLRSEFFPRSRRQRSSGRIPKLSGFSSQNSWRRVLLLKSLDLPISIWQQVYLQPQPSFSTGFLQHAHISSQPSSPLLEGEIWNLKHFHSRSKLYVLALTLPFSSVFFDAFSITLLYTLLYSTQEKLSYKNLQKFT